MGPSKRFRRVTLGLLLTLATFPACSQQGSDFPEIAGWTQPGEVLIYDPDILWEYINGQADFFIGFNQAAVYVIRGQMFVAIALENLENTLTRVSYFEACLLEISGFHYCFSLIIIELPLFAVVALLYHSRFAYPAKCNPDTR